MNDILTRLNAGRVLVCDGAMGTELQAAGLAPGECPELWCIERPEAVLEVHAGYRRAGSDIVECNSFGANRYKLRHFGLENRVEEINTAAAELARRVAGPDGYVMGSLGPTGAFMEPYGEATEKDFKAAFAEQAVALERGGADLVIVETMTAVEECVAAVRAVRENTELTVVSSFTLDPKADGSGYVSMMGVDPETYAKAARAAGAMILGVNCGTGPDDMIRIVGHLRAAAGGRPLLAMPNAGMPELENGRTVFRETPEEMGAKAVELARAGAAIVGGCCGTNARHIAAMVRELRAAGL